MYFCQFILQAHQQYQQQQQHLPDPVPTSVSAHQQQQQQLRINNDNNNEVPFPDAPPLEGDLEDVSIESGDFEGLFREDNGSRERHNSYNSEEVQRIPAKDRNYYRGYNSQYRQPYRRSKR